MVVASTTKTSVPAGTTPTWQPSTNLPQQSQMHLRVRSQDEYGRWSSWSGYYTFTVDTQPPASPLVTSAFYKHKNTGTWNGGVGVAGSFTFDPNGTSDVLKYEYRMNGGTISSVSVAAGASHTRDITPTSDLEQLLEVRSIDQAGWTSAWVAYPFLVRAQPVDVAYWKFDELSGTMAAAAAGGSDYNGTRIGGSGWAASGINPNNPSASGNAVSLDGVNDYVEMPRVLATNHTAGFSVSAWVKPTSLSTYHAVVSQQGANVFAFRLYYKPETNRWCFAVRDGDDTGAATYGVCSTLTPQVGVWTHLVGVYDRAAGKIRLYVNGGPFNGQAVPGTANEGDAPAMWAATGSFRVGRSFSSDYWAGLVDEVRAYQRALPEVEARQMFLDCLEGDCPQVPAPQDPVGQCTALSAPPCVGQWDMDAGAGTSADDSSGFGNHATLNGSAMWTMDGYDNSSGMAFDGASGFLATAGPVILTDQSFTVSAWVKPNQVSGGTYVVQQQGTSASSMILGTTSTGCWSFTTSSHNGVVHQWHPAASTITMRVGAWTHLVGVYDAGIGENRLYVNGHLAATRADAAGQPSIAGSPLLIGGTTWGGVLNGTIDLVRTYQGALSNAQVAALYADQLAPPDIRVWYELEEWDAQAYDYSENGNHGTLSAEGAMWTVDGHDGSSAVVFDGVAGSISTAGPVLQTTDSFSVTAWVKLADANAHHSVIGQDGAMNAAFLLYYSVTAGQWCFSMRHSDTPAPSFTQVCGPVPQVGVWTHLAGVYDAAAGQLRLYVNGTLAATQAYTASTWSANGSFVVGRSKYTDSSGTTALTSYFAGTIDGVRAYQGALSDGQVTAVFNGLDL